jgi:hypothetical protein
MVRTVAKVGAWRGRPLWRCSDRSCPGILNIDEAGEAEALAISRPFAGATAQAQFERERVAHAKRLRAGFPIVTALGLLSAGLVFFALLSFFELRWAALGASATLVGFYAWILRSMPLEAMWWLRGAEGERTVGRRLELLEQQGFVVLYDRRTPGRGGNTDAIAIGPPGVFAIEVKFTTKGIDVLGGQLTVGDYDRSDAVDQAVDRALRVQLSVADEMNARRLTVVPVLCFVGKRVAHGSRANGVLIVSDKDLARALLARPLVIPADEVSALARILDLSFPPYG